MTPTKKIYNHSFLYGLGKLKFFDDNCNPYCNQFTCIPLIEESLEFRPRIGLRSRYALTTVNNNYFETVVVGTP